MIKAVQIVLNRISFKSLTVITLLLYCRGASCISSNSTLGKPMRIYTVDCLMRNTTLLNMLKIKHSPGKGWTRVNNSLQVFVSFCVQLSATRPDTMIQLFFLPHHLIFMPFNWALTPTPGEPQVWMHQKSRETPHLEIYCTALTTFTQHFHFFPPGAVLK